ncbi:MAG: TetR/AcrR family transcriptional regulator [Armatimonadetes bacterium]|nr:TetR/AcrR family transcriptional regulator [Armatimonadota bacterium]
MGIRERRKRERENLQREILDAARDLFVSEGYEAVSMRRIASAIEYSPTAIYLYFADKDAIFAALTAEGFDLLSERLETKNGILDPVERLRAGGREYLAFAQEQPNYYAIMFEMKENDLHKNEVTETAGLRAFGFIVRAVSEGIICGKIAPATVEAVRSAAVIPGAEGGQSVCENVPQAILSHVYWASLHGATSLLLSGRLGMLPTVAHPYLLEAVIDNCLRGLICPPC